MRESKREKSEPKTEDAPVEESAPKANIARVRSSHGREIKVKDGQAYEDISVEEIDRRIAGVKARIGQVDGQVARLQERKVGWEAEVEGLEAIRAQLG